MTKPGGWLLVGWLLAALVLLGMDGRLPEFLAGAASGSLLVLGLGALVRQQLAPSRYNGPPLPERYQVADDLRQPIAAVVAVAEAEASVGGERRRWSPPHKPAAQSAVVSPAERAGAGDRERRLLPSAVRRAPPAARGPPPGSAR
jgi:hypothetical protein